MYPVTRKYHSNAEASVEEGMVCVSMTLDKPFIGCSNGDDNHSTVREHSPDVSHISQTRQESLFPVTAVAEQPGHIQSSLASLVKVSGAELTSPVRFSVDKDSRVCRIIFEQAFPGRYIHVMMWSTSSDPDSNVDIEAVLAYGLVGPRYNPPVEIEGAARPADKITSDKPCDI